MNLSDSLIEEFFTIKISYKDKIITLKDFFINTLKIKNFKETNYVIYSDGEDVIYLRNINLWSSKEFYVVKFSTTGIKFLKFN